MNINITRNHKKKLPPFFKTHKKKLCEKHPKLMWIINNIYFLFLFFLLFSVLITTNLLIYNNCLLLCLGQMLMFNKLAEEDHDHDMLNSTGSDCGRLYKYLYSWLVNLMNPTTNNNQQKRRIKTNYYHPYERDKRVLTSICFSFH